MINVAEINCHTAPISAEHLDKRSHLVVTIIISLCCVFVARKCAFKPVQQFCTGDHNW